MTAVVDKLPTTPARAEVFWTRVDKQPGDACWLWLGSGDRCGYGLFWTGATTTTAHRVAYELAIGPIPDGLNLDHKCKTPRCVRPDHLDPVTHVQNIRRAHGTQTHCGNGHEYALAGFSRRGVDGRRCLACHRDDARRRRNRKAIAAFLDSKPTHELLDFALGMGIVRVDPAEPDDDTTPDDNGDEPDDGDTS